MEGKSTEGRMDIRIIKTKRAIYNAIAQLLAEKDLDDISIRELTDLAEINRKTFYNYYSDLNALIDEIENEISEVFGQMIEGLDLGACLSDPRIIYDRIKDTISKREEFYGNLFRIEKNRGLVRKISDLLKERTRNALLEETGRPAEEVEVVADFIISGMMNVYQHWFSSKKEITLDQLSETVALLVSASLGIFSESSH